MGRLSRPLTQHDTSVQECLNGRLLHTERGKRGVSDVPYTGADSALMYKSNLGDLSTWAQPVSASRDGLGSWRRARRSLARDLLGLLAGIEMPHGVPCDAPQRP